MDGFLLSVAVFGSVAAVSTAAAVAAARLSDWRRTRDRRALSPPSTLIAEARDRQRVTFAGTIHLADGEDALTAPRSGRRCVAFWCSTTSTAGVTIESRCARAVVRDRTGVAAIEATVAPSLYLNGAGAARANHIAVEYVLLEGGKVVVAGVARCAEGDGGYRAMRQVALFPLGRKWPVAITNDAWFLQRRALIVRKKGGAP